MAGMRPRPACVRAGKTETAPGLTSIKGEPPGVGRAEVWRGREGPKDTPLTDTRSSDWTQRISALDLEAGTGEGRG